MKFFIWVVIILVCFASASVAETSDIKAGNSMPDAYKQQVDYLPDEFPAAFRLGMSYENFMSAANGVNINQHQKLTFRQELTREYVDKPFKSITYYFDLDNNQPLYEFIIEYPVTFALENYALAKYGDRNYGRNWILKTNDDFMVIIWIYENKLIIVGTIEGTQYQKNDKGQFAISKEGDEKLIKKLDGLFDDLKKQTELLREK